MLVTGAALGACFFAAFFLATVFLAVTFFFAVVRWLLLCLKKNPQVLMLQKICRFGK